MSRKKFVDPRRVALEDRAHKTRAEFERWYGRLKRAFNRCEKARRRLARLQKQLDRLENQPPPAA
jgi:hypothetical protein